MYEELTGTVVGVIDDPEHARDAVKELRAAGFSVKTFHGEKQRVRLRDDDGEGLLPTVRRLLLAFGDETRILDNLDRALANGSTVISVEVTEDGAPRVSEILLQHGGHNAWRLGEWSFNRVGEHEGEGAAPEAEE
jgi:hypothetical protein